MKNHYLILSIVLFVGVLTLALSPSASAQEDDCPTIVTTALDTIDEVCGGTGKNQVCYGNITLIAQPRADAGALVFEAVGDIADIANVQSLTLSASNEANGEWGVALMKIQANLPDTSPGINVIFLLFGQVIIEDAGAALAEAPEADPVTVPVTTGGSVNVRSGPSTDHLVVESLAAGQTVTAVGRLEDGSWLHIWLEDGTPGWVFTQLVNPAGDVTALPILDPASADGETVFGPFQAFYFQSVRADAPCDTAPDSGILIQSPQGEVTVELNVNDVRIALASTIYIQSQPDAEMVVNVVEGSVQVQAFDRTVLVPAGARVRIPVDADNKASGPPANPEPYDDSALAVLPVTSLPNQIDVAPAVTIAEPPANQACMQELAASVTSLAALESGVTTNPASYPSSECCLYYSAVLLYDPDAYNGALMRDFPRVCDLP